MQLLAADAGKFADLQKQSSTNVAKLASASAALRANEATLKAIYRKCDQ